MNKNNPTKYDQIPYGEEYHIFIRCDKNEKHSFIGNYYIEIDNPIKLKNNKLEISTYIQNCPIKMYKDSDNHVSICNHLYDF